MVNGQTDSFVVSQITWLIQRFIFFTVVIRISAIVMVKMGIFVVKFRGKILGWPFKPLENLDFGRKTVGRDDRVCGFVEVETL